MNDEAKISEKEDRDARYAVKEYLGYFIRKVPRAAEDAIHIIEMADGTGYDWLDIWGALMDLSRAVYEADREIEYALSVADKLFPHEEDNIPERKALVKPKKPEVKKSSGEERGGGKVNEENAIKEAAEEAAARIRAGINDILEAKRNAIAAIIKEVKE